MFSSVEVNDITNIIQGNISIQNELISELLVMKQPYYEDVTDRSSVLKERRIDLVCKIEANLTFNFLFLFASLFIFILENLITPSKPFPYFQDRSHHY